jgi:hypothetical protein
MSAIRRSWRRGLFSKRTCGRDFLFDGRWQQKTALVLKLHFILLQFPVQSAIQKSARFQEHEVIAELTRDVQPRLTQKAFSVPP